MEPPKNTLGFVLRLDIRVEAHQNLGLSPLDDAVSPRARIKNSSMRLLTNTTAAQWLQDLMFDLKALESVRNDLQFRGAQGMSGLEDTLLSR